MGILLDFLNDINNYFNSKLKSEEQKSQEPQELIIPLDEIKESQREKRLTNKKKYEKSKIEYQKVKEQENEIFKGAVYVENGGYDVCPYHRFHACKHLDKNVFLHCLADKKQRKCSMLITKGKLEEYYHSRHPKYEIFCQYYIDKCLEESEASYLEDLGNKCYDISSQMRELKDKM